MAQWLRLPGTLEAPVGFPALEPNKPKLQQAKPSHDVVRARFPAKATPQCPWGLNHVPIVRPGALTFQNFSAFSLWELKKDGDAAGPPRFSAGRTQALQVLSRATR